MKKQKISSYVGSTPVEIATRIKRDSEIFFKLPVKNVSLTACKNEYSVSYAALVVYEEED